MPSSHSATDMGHACAVGLCEGPALSLFPIAVVHIVRKFVKKIVESCVLGQKIWIADAGPTTHLAYINSSLQLQVDNMK